MDNDVFEVREGIIYINEFNKMIPEFRGLSNQESLLYIYHMGSYKSPYSNYDKSERKNKVIQDFCKNLVITQNHQAAIDKFIELQQTPTMRYLDANLIGMDKVRQFLLTVDLNSVDDKGKLLYKPYDITSAIKEAGKIVESVQALKDKVKKEISSSRGDAQAGYTPNDWEE
jgi:hypothetical protein